MEKDVLSKSRSVYAAITEKIIAAIEAGAGEFVMPWHRSSVGTGRPTNVLSAERYRGINVVSLWAEATLSGYATGYWGTYRQWQEVGGQVRRGEHGATIVFYSERVQPASPLREAADDERSPRFVARAFHVFNGAQVDGWCPPELAVTSAWEACEAAEVFVERVGATISHGHELACYERKADRICLPARERFVGSPTSSPAETYYATLLHELVHWTGASHRLDRPVGAFGSEKYAKEELVAELGAAFLCGDLGVANEPRRDHAAYVVSWLSVLRDDSRAIFKAARLAAQAASSLHAETMS